MRLKHLDPPYGLPRDSLNHTFYLYTRHKHLSVTDAKVLSTYNLQNFLLHLLNTPAVRITVIYSQNHPTYGPFLLLPADITVLQFQLH